MCRGASGVLSLPRVAVLSRHEDVIPASAQSTKNLTTQFTGPASIRLGGGRIHTSEISGRKFDISIRPIGRRVATKGVSWAFRAYLGKFRLPSILIIKPIHNVYPLSCIH